MKKIKVRNILLLLVLALVILIPVFFYSFGFFHYQTHDLTGSKVAQSKRIILTGRKEVKTGTVVLPIYHYSSLRFRKSDGEIIQLRFNNDNQGSGESDPCSPSIIGPLTPIPESVHKIADGDNIVVLVTHVKHNFGFLGNNSEEYCLNKVLLKY